MNNGDRIAYLGLGSNLGVRERTLMDALRRLDTNDSIRVMSVSAIYETEPVGYTDQPPFLNMVCRLATTLEPQGLLKEAMEIERRLGRQRTIRWGPRTIDIDILLFDNITMETQELIVPHPRIMERAFVLVPLLEIMPEDERAWRPGFEHAQVDNNGVRRWNNINWPGESAPTEN